MSPTTPMDLNDVEANFYKIALIGAFGSGKTRTAATAPGKQYWFCFENGLLSLQSSPVKDLKERLKFDFYPPIQKGTNPGKSSMLKALDKAQELYANNPYDVIIVDSVLSMSEAALLQAQIKLNTVGEPPQGFQVWGIVGQLGIQFCNLILNLPCNKIFCCHEEYEKDEVTGRLAYKIATCGNMISSWLPKEFDNRWRTEEIQSTKPEERSKYILRTEGNPTGKFNPNCRYAGLDPVEQPDISKILAKVQKVSE